MHSCIRTSVSAQLHCRRVVAPFQAMPYSALKITAQSTFFPLIVEDDRTYIVTLRYLLESRGRLVDLSVRWTELATKFEENTESNKMLIRCGIY